MSADFDLSPSVLSRGDFGVPYIQDPRKAEWISIFGGLDERELSTTCSRLLDALC